MAGYIKDKVYTWTIEGETMLLKPFEKTAQEAYKIFRELNVLNPEENWTITCLNGK